MSKNKVYIAFSIHGTNTFITATKELDISKLPPGMKVIPSRRPGYNPLQKGFKLRWDRLSTKQGQPLRSPPMILARFNELQKDGWVIDKTNFVDRHYASQYRKRTGENNPVPRGL